MSYDIIVKTRGKPEYEDEPVYWCKECKSLAIIDNSTDELFNFTSKQCYCKDCGSDKILIGMFDEWLDEVEVKGGEKKERERERRKEKSEIKRIKRKIIKQELSNIQINRSVTINLSDEDIYGGLEKWVNPGQ